MKRKLSTFMIFLAVVGISEATVYEVGPGKSFSSIGAVPWASLQPGDTVRIFYRSAPYREKWVICRQGTAAAPITVTGVPGPDGELPVVEGASATTAPGLNYWSEARGVVKIGGANTPPDTMPKYIVIEGLEIRGARSSYTFTDDRGATVAYSANASTIYVEKCENCTIRNNVLHDAGNGLFVASSDSAVSRNIIIEGNHIYDGGNSGSIYEHNVYSAALGIRFERNLLGRLISGAAGNNLKDRSAGTVIRYNWVEGGNRQLDFVDGEDSSIIRSDPSYRSAYVYGNVLYEYANDGNRQMIHYGGDSGSTSGYRKGTLYFYNNTMFSARTDRTTLFRASTNEETVEARNNIFYSVAAGSTVSLADASGVFNLSHNWIKPGWAVSFDSFAGTVNNDATMVTGSDPGFVDEAGQDYHLASGSQCVNAGGELNAAVLPAHDLTHQYVKHRSRESRPADAVLDIGAFELRPASGGTLVATVSAASFAVGAPVAPESIASAFGQGLAATPAEASATPLPTTLAGLDATVKDGAGVERAAPLFFVSPGQINYLIPQGTRTGPATVTVNRGSQVLASGTLRIEAVAPGLFSANANGRGVAAAVAVRRRADNSQSWDYVFQAGSTTGSHVPKPIDLGSETDRVDLQLFGTGIRGVSSLAAVSAKIGGESAAVMYAGPQGGFVGLDQVNVGLPRSLVGRGEVEVVLTLEGKVANPVTVHIK